MFKECFEGNYLSILLYHGFIHFYIEFIKNLCNVYKLFFSKSFNEIEVSFNQAYYFLVKFIEVGVIICFTKPLIYKLILFIFMKNLLGIYKIFKNKFIKHFHDI